MKKIMGLGLLLVSLAYSEYVSSVTRAYMPEESSIIDNSCVYAPATVFYDGVFHQFYCSTGGNTDGFFVHPDDGDGRASNEEKNGFVQSGDHIRYRTSKNGSSWSPARIVMTQTKFSYPKRQNFACDPAVIKHGDYWYLYYAGNIDNYNTVMYVSRSKTIGGPYLTLTEENGENKWERWPQKPKPILKKETGHKKTDNSIYGMGQLSVVKRNGKFHFWFADNSEKENAKEIKIKYATSDSPTSIPKPWTTITIKNGPNKTDKNGYLPVVEFGEVRWNYNSSKYEMWLLSKCMGANQRFYKYTSAADDGKSWEVASSSTYFGGPYYDANNLGVSGDENGWIYDRYILSFAAPSKGLNKKASDFSIYDRYGKKKVYASFPWAMYQMIVGDWQDSRVQISYKQKFPDGVTSDKFEYITGDFDGDGVTDLVAVDRRNSKWYIRSSQSGQKGVANIPWGWKWEGMSSNHTIVTGDYDGDGKTDRVIVDRSNGLWYMISSRTGLFMTNPANGNEILFGWKWVEMGKQHVVVAGDYDGDGKTDRAIVDTTNGKWCIISSRTGVALEPDNSISLKTPDNKKIWDWKFPNWNKKYSRVLVGDFDRDGITDIGMVNVSTRQWYIYTSQTGKRRKNIVTGESYWGTKWECESWDKLSPNSVVTMGDYDGDGITEEGFFDWSSRTWYNAGYNPYVNNLNGWNQMNADLSNVKKYKVLEGDYDGDGATDHGIVDLETQKVYIYSSVRGKSGVDVTIRHVYPFSTKAVLKKETAEEKNEDLSIPMIANVARVSIDGSKLIIEEANDGDKVSITDIQGKVVSKSVITGNSMTVQLPSTGVYIVRVGSLNRKVFVK